MAHLRLVLQLMGALLLPPVVVALVFQEFFFAILFGSLAVGVFLLGWIKTSRRRPDLELKEALVVTALSYLIFSLVGGIVFLPQAPYIDGFFESMSGFTTTGLSTLDLSQLPNSLLFFRASTQWVGGAGIIVITLVILSGPGKAPFRLYVAEFGGENLVGSVVATARVVIKVYLILTALGFLALWGAGMTPFDSLLHVLTSVSTGGFSPHPDSIGYYQRPAIQIAVTVLMVLGAISLPLFYLARREGAKRFIRDLQLRYLVAIILIGTVIFVGVLGWRSQSILPGLFQATSATTGTGFTSVDSNSWPEGSRLLTVALMLIGGSTGSTTGGIKLLRLIILLKLGEWLLARVLLPQEARLPPIRYGSIAISEMEVKEIAGFVLLFVLVFAGAALALALAGYTAIDSLFESASALGTVGMSSGITSAGAPLWVKLLLAFEMWVGRLEILPALALLYPGVWKRRRRLA
jgi:trk system potassium uptake protein TrkH